MSLCVGVYVAPVVTLMAVDSTVALALVCIDQSAGVVSVYVCVCVCLCVCVCECV